MRKFPAVRCFHSLSTAATAEAVAKARPAVNLGRQRVDVVSAELCDDALNLLRPSLDQYKGCRILDFNPGCAVWSSRLHDAIKPTTHVLIDKERDTYAPFWEPLFNEPNSHYRHIPGDLFNLRISPAFVDDVFHGPSRSSQAKSPESHDSYTPLLITANASLFSRHQLLSKHHPTALNNATRFQVHKLLTSLHRLSVGQPSTPPPRLLVWTNDHDRHAFLPRVIASRKHNHITLEERWDISEIIGAQDRASKGDRAAAEELLSALWTAQRMHAAGIELPPARRSVLHALALADMHVSPEIPRSGQAMDAKPQYTKTPLMAELEEFRNLWRDASADLEARIRPSTTAGRKGKLSRQRRPNDKRIREIDRYINGLVQGVPLRKIYLPDRIAMRHRTLNDIERQVARMRREMTPSDLGSTKESLQALKGAEEQMAQITEELARVSEGLNLKERGYVRKLVDDYEVLVHRDPPLLMWDQRAHEPLQAAEGEFYPADRKVALISFTLKRPEDHSTYIPTNMSANTERKVGNKRSKIGAASEESRSLNAAPHYLSNHPLVRALLDAQHKPQSLPAALEAISHGSSSDLIPKCPSLNDPLRGGHYDPERLRACALTLEQLHELVNAWDESPFSASQEELVVDDGDRGIAV